MTSYLITWIIDIEADSPEEAAEEALTIQRRPNSIATVFEVLDMGTDVTTTVDLNPEEGGTDE